MRQAVGDYVTAAHRAYLAQATLLPPALQGALPLLAGGPFTVAAAGAGDLHVVATRQAFGPPRGPEVEVPQELPPLRWSLRFYDPVVLPELGLLAAADGPEAVRTALGIRIWLYHLVVQPGSELGEHHAGHAGTALAHAHGAAARDFEAIRAHAGRAREGLVLEMEGAATAGLTRAQALLARALAPGDAAVEAEAARADPDAEALRRAVLAALRRHGDE